MRHTKDSKRMVAEVVLYSRFGTCFKCKSVAFNSEKSGSKYRLRPWRNRKHITVATLLQLTDIRLKESGLSRKDFEGV